MATLVLLLLLLIAPPCSAQGRQQKVRLHVIALDADEQSETHAQLQSIAAASNGTFHSADNLNELVVSMKSAAGDSLFWRLHGWIGEHLALVLLLTGILLIISLTVIVILVTGNRSTTRVTVGYPDGNLRVWSLRPGRHVIGRATSASIRLHPQDMLCSRQHAELKVGPLNVTVSDCDTPNGTWLLTPSSTDAPQRRLTEATPLRPGAMIRIGRHSLWINTKKR